MNRILTMVFIILSTLGWFFMMAVFIIGDLTTGPMMRLSILTIVMSLIVYKYGDKDVFMEEEETAHKKDT